MRLKQELKKYIDNAIEEQVPIHIKKHKFPTCPHAIDPVSGLAIMSTTDGTRTSMMKDGNVSIGDNYQVADHESIWRSHPPFQNEDFAN